MPTAVTGEASGHPHVRATHRKTLELARDLDITARATCVVGVGVRIDEPALAGLQGLVALTLTVGGLAETVRGRLNPAFRPGDPLVVRRAPAVTRDAVIVAADRAASDLPRSFVDELAGPSALVAVTIEELEGEAAPEVLIADLSTDRDAVHAAHAAGNTVLPAQGLSLPDAVRAVGGLEPDAEVIEDVAAETLARRLRGAERGAIVLDPGTPREEYLPWRAGARLEIPGARGRRAAFAVETRAAEPTGAAAPPPAALDRARALAAAGASTRDVARALQDDAGLPHRRAYELALDLTAETSSVSRPEPRTSR